METHYTYDDCNRLLEVSGAEQEILSQYQYDAQGNLIQDERARYTVDAINRVVQAETFEGNIQINRYDAEGLRAEMEENGRISKFVFDGKNVVAEETDGDVIRYIRGDRLVASDSEHARTYYHYVGDELGSVTHVVKGDKKENFDKEESESSEQSYSVDRILNHYIYDVFGNRTVSEEKIANRFGYAGEQYDEITQQYYLRARFYNPVIGRFTQEDTYYGDGLNLYEYGRNNPMRYIDPSGHEVRAAAEKNYVNRAVDAMNKAADQGVDGMLERVYGSGEGNKGIIDYSYKFDKELVNFNDGYKIKNTVQKDLILVQYSSDAPDASLCYWTTIDEANGITTLDDYMNKLALSKDWGSRNTIKVARIPAGTDVKHAIGTAREQLLITDPRPGGGVQYLFDKFDKNWITEIRSYSN